MRPRGTAIGMQQTCVLKSFRCCIILTFRLCCFLIQAVADATKKREEEERGDAMKVLENKTYDSKVEMDILAALDEMKSIRSRQATVDTDSMLEALKRTQEDRVRDPLIRQYVCVAKCLVWRVKMGGL